VYVGNNSENNNMDQEKTICGRNKNSLANPENIVGTVGAACCFPRGDHTDGSRRKTGKMSPVFVI
jgi:hypothetical protein